MLNRVTNFACFTLLTALLSIATSHASAAPTPVLAQQIVNAMVSTGITLSPDQIEPLSDVGSVPSTATIRVVSVSDGADGTNTVKAKLRCHDNRECLPFYVLVHGVTNVNAIQLGSHTAPLRKGSSLQGSLQNVVRGGDHATLILETPDARMSLPVICLQSGMPGQKIRAASLDRKRFFDVEVVAAGMLKGNL